MDVLGFTTDKEVYSTFQCKGCESVLPGTVAWVQNKRRTELGPVSLDTGRKEASNFSTLVACMHLHKKCLPDLVQQL